MIVCEYKLGLTLNGLTRLPDLGVPDPFVPPFNEFALRSVGGDGIIRGDGYPNFVWGWPSMNAYGLQRLRAFVTVGNASIRLFVRTRLNDFTFANFSAVMALPVLSGDDGAPAEGDVPNFANVTLRFSHLIAV